MSEKNPFDIESEAHLELTAEFPVIDIQDDMAPFQSEPTAVFDTIPATEFQVPQFESEEDDSIHNREVFTQLSVVDEDPARFIDSSKLGLFAVLGCLCFGIFLISYVLFSTNPSVGETELAQTDESALDNSGTLNKKNVISDSPVSSVSESPRQPTTTAPVNRTTTNPGATTTQDVTTTTEEETTTTEEETTTTVDPEPLVE